MNWERSKDPVFWTILFVDLLPAAGYFLGGWQVVDLVFLFWAETAVLFLIALATALTCSGPVKWTNIFFGLFMGAWFILLFLMFVCGMDPRLSGAEKDWPYLALPRLIWEDKVWPQILIFSIMHWAGFFSRLAERARLLNKGEAAQEGEGALQGALTEPVQRIVVLFLSMFLGIMVAGKIHNFGGIFFLLLGFKVWFDVYAYLRTGKQWGESSLVP